MYLTYSSKRKTIEIFLFKNNIMYFYKNYRRTLYLVTSFYLYNHAKVMFKAIPCIITPFVSILNTNSTTNKILYGHSFINIPNIFTWIIVLMYK